MAAPSIRRITQRSASSQEDTLTEVFALALSIDPGLAQDFLADVWLHANSCPECQKVGIKRVRDRREWSVEVQGGTTGARPDLILRSSEAGGAQVWIENKIASDENPGQLAKYLGELSETIGQERAVVFVTKQGLSGGPVHREIGRGVVGEVGLFHYDWTALRNLLAGTEKRVDSRLAKALVQYLSDSGATLKPISAEDITLMERFQGARASLHDSLTQIAQRIDERLGGPTGAWPSVGSTAKQWSDFPRWVRNYEEKLSGSSRDGSLLLEWSFRVWESDDLDEFAPGLRGKPAFGWGLTYTGSDGWLMEVADKEWRVDDLHHVTEEYSRLFRFRSLESWMDEQGVLSPALLSEIADKLADDLGQIRARLSEVLATDNLLEPD